MPRTMKQPKVIEQRILLAPLTSQAPHAIIPAAYQDGLSLKEFTWALVDREGCARFVLPFKSQGPADAFIRLSDFAIWTQGKWDASGEFDILAASEPALLDLRTFTQPSVGAALVHSIGETIYLNVGDRRETLGVRGDALIFGDSMFKAPASPDEQRIVIERLKDHGAHLLVHAGDHVSGFWRLAQPVSEEQARVLTAQLARRIPGAVQVRDGLTHAGHPLANAWIAAPEALVFSTPAPRPAARIVPRTEFVAWGDVSATVSPEELAR